MSGLGRNKNSGSWVGRKRIPTAIRAAYAETFGAAWEAKFTRPATLGEREARAAHAEWLALVEGRINLITAEVQGLGVDLNHKQAHALAGRWYRWKTARHGDDPGSPQRWTDEITKLIADIADLGEAARRDKSADHDSEPCLGPDCLPVVHALKMSSMIMVRDPVRADAFLADSYLMVGLPGYARVVGEAQHRHRGPQSAGTSCAGRSN